MALETKSKESFKTKTAKVEEAKRVYVEEQIRLISAKSSMTKTIKKLESSLQEGSELEELSLPDGGLVKIAMLQQSKPTPVRWKLSMSHWSTS